MNKTDSSPLLMVDIPENQSVQLPNGLIIKHLRTKHSSQPLNIEGVSSPSSSVTNLTFELEFEKNKKVVSFTAEEIGVVPKTEELWLHFKIIYLSEKQSKTGVNHHLKIITQESR